MVQNFHLQNFMSQMKDGARSNQFYCDLSLPTALVGSIPNGVMAENKMKFFVKSSALPSMSIGRASAWFRGAEFKLAGDKTFSDWTFTIVNDTDFIIRDAFERWNDMIIGNTNRDSFLEDDPTAYMSNGTVAALSRNSKVLKQYQMIGAWPSEIAEIAVDHSQNDSIQEFQVTMTLQWWEALTTRNNSSGEIFGSFNGGQPSI